MNPVRASRSFLTPPRQHLLHRPPRGSCRNSRKRSPTVYPHSPCGSPAGRVPARTIWPLAPMIYLRFSSWGAAPCRAPLPMEKYDLIVIGSGPGGQRAAIQAAKFGKKADRKSTRLNSSHSQISYAVFCLKKKKKKTHARKVESNIQPH